MSEVNIDLLIVKLQREAESSAVFVTVKAALIEMAVRGLEQQKAQIEAMTLVVIPALDVTIANTETPT